MDRMVTIVLDADLDLKLEAFQKQLTENEQIVHQVVAGNKLILTVRETKKTKRNLLLEEYGNRMK